MRGGERMSRWFFLAIFGQVKPFWMDESWHLFRRANDPLRVLMGILSSSAT